MWDKPTEVSQVDMAFGAAGNLSKYLPDMKEIPENIDRKWMKLTSKWFFRGLNGDFVPKDGIDKNVALRHLKTILGSFEPKHQHKEAGVAYLMSLWFSDFIEETSPKSDGAKSGEGL